MEAAGKNTSARNGRSTTLIIIAAAAIFGVALLAGCFAGFSMLGGTVSRLARGETDITRQISAFTNRDFVSSRSLWLTHMDGEIWLQVDGILESFPSPEQYRANPGQSPRVVDQLPADTTFQIISCRKQESQFNATLYKLTVEVTNGTYAGNAYTMFAADVFSAIGDETGVAWKLQDHIKPPAQ